MRYVRYILPSAYADMDRLERFIEKECAAPLTAARQFELLYKIFNWLGDYAELPAVDVNLSIQYGKIVRHVRFGKKMAILYFVEDNTVYILRIIPQSMILL